MRIERVLISTKPNIDHKKIAEIVKIFHSKNISVFSLQERDFKNQKLDLVFVFGGDGAILRTVERIIKLPNIPPIVGVNMGKVGFLTFGESSLENIIDKLKKDEYIVNRKRLMQISDTKIFALNDVVVKCSELCDFEIKIDEQDCFKVRADGVIISSQTGSTAYNLSVGGPLVMPDIDIFIISFIAPFSLSARTIIVAPKRKIKIASKTHCSLYSDGNLVSDIKYVEVKYSKKTIDILREPSFSFFKILKKKLESPF